MKKAMNWINSRAVHVALCAILAAGMLAALGTVVFAQEERVVINRFPDMELTEEAEARLSRGDTDAGSAVEDYQPLVVIKAAYGTQASAISFPQTVSAYVTVTTGQSATPTPTATPKETEPAEATPAAIIVPEIATPAAEQTPAVPEASAQPEPAQTPETATEPPVQTVQPEAGETGTVEIPAESGPVADAAAPGEPGTENPVGLGGGLIALRDNVPVVMIDTKEPREIPVTWECDAYDPKTPGDYVFLPKLPVNCRCDGVLPHVLVRVAAAEPSAETSETPESAPEPTPEGSAVTAIASFAVEPIQRSVGLGTPVSELVAAGESAQESAAESGGESETAANGTTDGQTTAPETAETKPRTEPLPASLRATGPLGEELTVPVRWSSADYAADTAGTYTFTAAIAGEAYSYDGAPVTARVTVGDVGQIKIASFATFENEIDVPLGTLEADLPLPQTLAALDKDGNTVDVAVTWSCTEEKPNYTGYTERGSDVFRFFAVLEPEKYAYDGEPVCMVVYELVDGMDRATLAGTIQSLSVSGGTLPPTAVRMARVPRLQRVAYTPRTPVLGAPVDHSGDTATTLTTALAAANAILTAEQAASTEGTASRPFKGNPNYTEGSLMALRSAVTYAQGLVSPTKVAEDYARLQILGCIHALEILNTSASKGSIITLNNYPDLTKQYDYEIDVSRDDLDSIYKFDIVFALDWSGSMSGVRLMSKEIIEATADYMYARYPDSRIAVMGMNCITNLVDTPGNLNIQYNSAFVDEAGFPAMFASIFTASPINNNDDPPAFLRAAHEKLSTEGRSDSRKIIILISDYQLGYEQESRDRFLAQVQSFKAEFPNDNIFCAMMTTGAYGSFTDADFNTYLLSVDSQRYGYFITTAPHGDRYDKMQALLTEKAPTDPAFKLRASFLTSRIRLASPYAATFTEGTGTFTGATSYLQVAANSVFTAQTKALYYASTGQPETLYPSMSGNATLTYDDTAHASHNGTIPFTKLPKVFAPFSHTAIEIYGYKGTGGESSAANYELLRTIGSVVPNGYGGTNLYGTGSYAAFGHEASLSMQWGTVYPRASADTLARANFTSVGLGTLGTLNTTLTAASMTVSPSAGTNVFKLYYSVRKVTGTVWSDNSREGMITSLGTTDRALPGVTVWLLKTDGTKVLDSGGSTVSAVTDANGVYALNVQAVSNGTYWVGIDTPANYEATLKSATTDNKAEKSGTMTVIKTVNLTGSMLTGQNLGLRIIPQIKKESDAPYPSGTLAAPTEIASGQAMRYTITITNPGTNALDRIQNMTVTDLLPAGVTLTNATFAAAPGFSPTITTATVGGRTQVTFTIPSVPIGANKLYISVTTNNVDGIIANYAAMSVGTEDPIHSEWTYHKILASIYQLTINKNLTAAAKQAETFVFKVERRASAGDPLIETFYATIRIPAGGTSNSVRFVKLFAGYYTVTEMESSWRYDASGGTVKSVTIASSGAAPGTASVSFTNSRTNDKWIGGSDTEENTFVVPAPPV